MVDIKKVLKHFESFIGGLALGSCMVCPLSAVSATHPSGIVAPPELSQGDALLSDTAAIRRFPSVEGPLVLVMGDSFSAGYGLLPGQDWVSLMELYVSQEIQAKPTPVVFNASVNGETTAGGLLRLPTLLGRLKPKVVVIELGVNDALKGLPIREAQAHLETMVELSESMGARVVLVGTTLAAAYGQAYGPAYREEFAHMFSRLAGEKRIGLVPFIFAGVAEHSNEPDFFQADALHPNAKAQPIMLSNIWPEIQKVLQSLDDSSKAEKLGLQQIYRSETPKASR